MKSFQQKNTLEILCAKIKTGFFILHASLHDNLITMDGRVCLLL
jgi:hypothetical protein